MFCSVCFIVAHVHASAVHGTRVTFGLPCRVNNSHQTASKLLQDHALRCCFRLAHLLSLLCLRQKAFTGCIGYLLGYKREGQPETKQNIRSPQQAAYKPQFESQMNRQAIPALFLLPLRYAAKQILRCPGMQKNYPASTI